MLLKKNPYGVSLVNVYRLTIQALITEPKLWLPFLILLFLHLIALAFAYLAPREPLIELLGPPIRRFYGEIYLHYPAHLLIIPRLSAQAQKVITIIAGPLLIGTAVSMVGAAYREKRLLFWRSFKTALLRYIQVLFIFFIIFYAADIATGRLRLFLERYFSAGNEKLLMFDASWWQGSFIGTAYFVIFLIVQALLIYSIPMVLIDNIKLFTAIVKSISLFLRMITKTIFLIAMPMCFYIPVLILILHAPVIVNKFFPDAVFGICAAGSLLNWLLIDLLIHTSTAFAYLESKHHHSA